MTIQPSNMSTFSPVGQSLTVPSRLLRDKPGIVSMDKNAVTYACNVCGTVEPYSAFSATSQNEVTHEPVKVYIRRPCKCERDAQDMAELIRLRKETAKSKVSATYRWLGMEDEDLEGKSFSNFDPSVQGQRKAAFQQALDVAKQYALAVAQNQRAGNLIAFGNYGTGKTHLVCAILNYVREQGVSCLFCTVSGLFSKLYAADFEQKQVILDLASSTKLLVLDDLDKLYVRADTDGAFQKRTLFDVLDKRYRKHLPTIITTNAQADLSTWLDGASISRLSEHATKLDMKGADYRPRRQFI